MVKHKYLKVIREILLAVSRDDMFEIRDWGNQLCNLAMDEEHPTKFEKVTAENLSEELELEIAESKYELAYGE